MNFQENPLSEAEIEKMLFRYLELAQDANEAWEEKSALLKTVRKVPFTDLKIDVNGDVNDKSVDVKFISEFNKIDAKEAEALSERKQIYEKLYKWRYPRRDESYNWWIKAGKWHFMFDTDKQKLEIR